MSGLINDNIFGWHEPIFSSNFKTFGSLSSQSGFIIVSSFSKAIYLISPCFKTSLTAILFPSTNSRLSLFSINLIP